MKLSSARIKEIGLLFSLRSSMIKHIFWIKKRGRTLKKRGFLYNLAEMLDFPGIIPVSEVRRFIRYSKTVTIPKNWFFLRAGEIPGRIGLIRKGLLRLYYIDPDGLEVTKHFCTEKTAAISFSACSHEIRSHFPSPRFPTRLSGYKIRSGS